MRRRGLLLTASLPLAALLLLGATGPLAAAELARRGADRPRRASRSAEDAGDPEPSRAVASATAAATAVLGVAAAPAPSAPAAVERPDPWAATVARLDALLDAASRKALVAVAVRGPRGETYRRGATRPMAMASLYKLLVLAAAHESVARGVLAWTQRVVLLPEDLREGSRFAAGSAHTVDALVDGMVTESDNGAAIALVRTLGGAAPLNAAGRRLGMRDTAMVDGRDVADRLDGYNYTTAADVETYFATLLAGAFVDAATSAAMLARLERNRIRDRLPALLPPDARVADKTGELPGIRNDAGVVYTPAGPFVVAALTFAYPDVAAATRAIAEVGRAVWDHASSSTAGR